MARTLPAPPKRPTRDTDAERSEQAILRVLRQFTDGQTRPNASPIARWF
jgi:hypothetical protein